MAGYVIASNQIMK